MIEYVLGTQTSRIVACRIIKIKYDRVRVGHTNSTYSCMQELCVKCINIDCSAAQSIYWLALAKQYMHSESLYLETR